MKICMLIEAWKPIWAGGQIHVLELCKHLIKKHKVSIDLYVMNLDGKRKESLFNNKLNIIRVGEKTTFNTFSRLKWMSEVVKLASKKKYDIIHAHANLPGIPGKQLSRKLKVPVIYTVHGSGVQAMRYMYGSGPKAAVFAKMEHYLHTQLKYDKIISVDSKFAQQRNVNKNIAIIPNGVDIKKFDSVKTSKSKKFKILYVGRLHPQKGLKYLIKALGNIKSKLKDVEVHIVGMGDQEGYLKDLVRKEGVAKYIKFRGKILDKKLIKEYKSSYLFVLPSLYEGQPLTLLEAWAAKLPVLVTNVGGNSDFVVNGKNGVIIAPQNVTLLSTTLLSMIKTKPTMLKAMGDSLIYQCYVFYLFFIN